MHLHLHALYFVFSFSSSYFVCVYLCIFAEDCVVASSAGGLSVAAPCFLLCICVFAFLVIL